MELSLQTPPAETEEKDVTEMCPEGPLEVYRFSLVAWGRRLTKRKEWNEQGTRSKLGQPVKEEDLYEGALETLRGQ